MNKKIFARLLGHSQNDLSKITQPWIKETFGVEVNRCDTLEAFSEAIDNASLHRYFSKHWQNDMSFCQCLEKYLCRLALSMASENASSVSQRLTSTPNVSLIQGCVIFDRSFWLCPKSLANIFLFIYTRTP